MMWKNVILAIFLCMVFTATAQASYWNLNDDGTTNFNVLRLLALAWLEPDCGLTNSCNGLDVYPECGDGTVDFRDYAVIASVFRECTDPANPYCNHIPLTLYEPPNISSLGEGVQPFSGEFQITKADLVIPGRGLDFSWARTYRSRTGSNTTMGNGWDFSYNIYLKSCSGNLIVHDGTGRKDTYYPQANGTWTADGFFGELQLQPGNSFFTLTFPDASTWQFLALDDTNAPGKIDTIVDRNGNSLNFQYDTQGRLTTVRDPLDTGSNGRVITIGYDTDDLIVDVTDWTGRQIKYEYYDDRDADGSAGDLKSVTSPAVTGTPTGNDFPLGKTTIYTYSKSFADEELNHNLLTITNPNGQRYLTNTYGTRYGETDYDFVTRQMIGGTNAIINFTSQSQAANTDNNYAVTRVVVNDRVGNVSEYFYDNRNRLTIERNYTGRAPDSKAPTNINPHVNIPVNPLRSGDPAFFETRYEYNSDSLLTRVIRPNQNEELFNYDESNSDRRSQGNLLQTCRLPGPLGADQSSICETFEYDPVINHNTNMVTRSINLRDYETLFEYDARGNLTSSTEVIPGPSPNIIHQWQYNQFGQMTNRILPDNGSGSSRRDNFTYYADPADPSYGYSKGVIIDANNLALTTTFEYDAAGNVTKVTNPNGNDTQYVVNQLNQVLRRISREVTSGSALRYERDTHYDENDNIIQVDVRDINDSGILQTDPDITTTYEYDILNRLIRTTAEVNSVRSIVTEYEYDDNGNLTLTRFGEATKGGQPNNVVRTVYDERDMVYTVTRAEGDPDQSTTQYDYDGNGNITKTSEATEDKPNVTYYVCSGFDRVTLITDPMGNTVELHYDENSNVTNTMNKGELIDAIGSSGNVRLTEVTNEFDSLDRVTRTITSFFDPNTQLPIDDGSSITEFEYNDNSQIIKVTDDNGNQTHYEYDTANRKSETTDAKGNRFRRTYDRASNVIEVNEVDISDLAEPNKAFVTTYAYDGLNRLIRVVDNNRNTTLYGYDSRNNRTISTDALGNATRREYDAINRLVKTIRDMDGDGADASDADDMVTSRAYDDSSRLIEQTDNNGNATAYEYDALNRMVKTTYADGTNETSVYDVHDNMVGYTDAVGTTGVMAYNKLHRLTRADYIPGAGVATDSNFQEFKYDGLSRMVYAENNNSVVTLSYDSLSNIGEEVGGGKVIRTSSDGLGNTLSCAYPGGRVITNTYDALNRKKTISEGVSSIGSYDYVGRGRVRKLSYGNGIGNNYSYDNVRRITGTKHSKGVAIVDERSYSYDATHNKIQRKDKRVGGLRLTHDYTYDSMHRLRNTSVTGSVPRNTQYTLDGVGNRTSVTGSPDPGLYTMSSIWPTPADFWMNQYTQVPWLNSIEYDDNGNLTTALASADSDPVTSKYDVFNMLVEVNDISTGIATTFTYDALKRRIRKHTSGGGLPSTTTNYFYDGARVVEEQNDVGATQATYVYGNYVDEVLNMQRNGNDYYYHADDMYNVMAITDSNGIAVERYEYGDYGEPSFILTTAGVDNPYLFNGRRYDSETGLYYYRTRYLDPRAGRFTSRDSIGIWGDPANMGNGSTYLGSNPWSGMDPFGLKGKYCVCSMSKCSCGCKNIIMSTEIVAMLSDGGGGNSGGGNVGINELVPDTIKGVGVGHVNIIRRVTGGDETVLTARSNRKDIRGTVGWRRRGRAKQLKGFLMFTRGSGDHNGQVAINVSRASGSSGGGTLRFAIREGGRTIGASQIARRGRARQLKGYLMSIMLGNGDHNGQVSVKVTRANGGIFSLDGVHPGPKLNFNTNEGGSTRDAASGLATGKRQHGIDTGGGGGSGGGSAGGAGGGLGGLFP